MESSKYLTVNALTKYLKYKFDQDPYLTQVFLKGELSNVKHHSGGHLYFSVKDDKAVIKGVMFNQGVKRLKFKPEEGMSVIIEGRISIFERQGNYQIYAENIEIDGVGLLFEQLEKDKKELREQGFLNPEHKKTIPQYPSHIVIITSETSAAKRDMLTTIERRFPALKVTIINTLMQGSASKNNVIDNLKRADALGADTIILSRGGGSIEDLWTFNEKEVALSVFHTHTPVITAIGHETDTTLVDYVSDLRAATPTAASEQAVPDIRELLIRITESRLYLYKRTLEKLKVKRNELTTLSQYYKLRSPELLYDQETERLSNLHVQLTERVTRRQKDARYDTERLQRHLSYLNPAPEIQTKKSHLKQTVHTLKQQMNLALNQSQRDLMQSVEMLDSLSPTAILKRGYSFTTQNENIIKHVDDVNVGDSVKTTLNDGFITSKITGVNKND